MHDFIPERHARLYTRKAASLVSHEADYGKYICLALLTIENFRNPLIVNILMFGLASLLCSEPQIIPEMTSLAFAPLGVFLLEDHLHLHLEFQMPVTNEG